MEVGCGEEEFVTVPFLQCLQKTNVTFLHQLPSTLQEHFLEDNNEEKKRCHEEMGNPVVISLRVVDLILKSLV